MRTTLLAENGIRSKPSVFNNFSLPARQDIDQLEHLDRLEDIELTGVIVPFQKRPLLKRVAGEELLKLEQILLTKGSSDSLKRYILTIPKGQR